MNRIFTYLLLLIVCVSCYKVEKPEAPENLLPQDDMVKILVDIYLVTSAKGVNRKQLEESGVSIDGFIYEKHNIDSLQFAKSNEFYAYDVEVYDGIYARVKKNLTALKKTHKAISEKEEKVKAKKDSITRKRRRDSLNLINEEKLGRRPNPDRNRL